MTVTYMNGAGNDFMVIDARDKALDFHSLAVSLCTLTGADGFMAIDHSSQADFRLHFYNSDGSRGEMCGNGARCICRYAYEHGIAGKTMTVETDAGLISGSRIDETHYRILLNLPSVVDLNRIGNVAYVELGKPGIPHGILEIPGLRWEMAEALQERARLLRHDPAFPKGANINLYTWLDEHTVRLLTYERGVEDFTLACGTGSGATAVVLWTQKKLPQGQLTVKNKGGDLKIFLEEAGGILTKLQLEGPTQIVREYTV